MGKNSHQSTRIDQRLSSWPLESWLVRKKRAESFTRAQRNSISAPSYGLHWNLTELSSCDRLSLGSLLSWACKFGVKEGNFGFLLAQISSCEIHFESHRKRERETENFPYAQLIQFGLIATPSLGSAKRDVKQDETWFITASLASQIDWRYREFQFQIWGMSEQNRWAKRWDQKCLLSSSSSSAKYSNNSIRMI